MRHMFKGLTLKGVLLNATVLAAALTAGSAFAHQANPQCYLDGVQIRPVAKFAFSSKQAADFHADLLRRPPGSCPASTRGAVTKSCGQVDHYHVVTIMAGEYCAKLQGAKASATRPVAEISGPASYRSPEHHLLYTYKRDDPRAIVLEGMCVICETIEIPAQK